ncbi:MAG: hypothetical protein ACN6N0_12795, partial [Microvirgula sp.]
MKRRELLLGLALAPWLTLAQAGPAPATVFGRPPVRVRRVFAAGAPAGVLALLMSLIVAAL